jgi:hypothetical protein
VNLRNSTTHKNCYVVSYEAELLPGFVIEHVALMGGRVESEAEEFERETKYEANETPATRHGVE